MQFQRDDPRTWPYKPTIIAHDVGRSRDRSTAVVGGLCPLAGSLIGMEKFIELPQNLFGTDRVEALAAIDREYHSRALIVADLSNDASYGEIFAKRFGPRAIGLNIGRSGDGMTWDRRSFSGAPSLFTMLAEHSCSSIFTICWSLTRFVSWMGQKPDKHTSSWPTLTWSCARRGRLIRAHPDSTMTLVSRVRCWPFLPGTGICRTTLER
jgi:hypothetical protein